MSRIGALPGVILAGSLGLLADAAVAQDFDLRYTKADFNFLYTRTDSSGSETDPLLQQTVNVETDDGSGVGIDATVALPANFFLIGDFSAAVVNIDADIFNPIATVSATDDFVLIQWRAGLGYAFPISDAFHLYAGVTYDYADWDLGSLAGESFAADDTGIGGRIGFRAKVGRQLELGAYARYTDVGQLDLNQGDFDSDVLGGANVLYYLSPAFALGARIEYGDVEYYALSLRFGFGRLKIGG